MGREKRICLVKQHFSHPHILKLINQAESETLTCNVCEQRNITSCNFYGCNTCQYFLHENCLNAPRFLNHSSHPSHHLTLLPIPTYSNRSFTCKACGAAGNGCSFSCACCGFDIHIQCALLPQTVFQSQHPHHELELIFESPFDDDADDESTVFVCDVCHDNVNLNYWLYYCADCDFGAHIECAISKSVGQLQERPKLSVNKSRENPVVTRKIEEVPIKIQEEEEDEEESEEEDEETEEEDEVETEEEEEEEVETEEKEEEEIETEEEEEEESEEEEEEEEMETKEEEEEEEEVETEKEEDEEDEDEKEEEEEDEKEEEEEVEVENEEKEEGEVETEEEDEVETENEEEEEVETEEKKEEEMETEEEEVETEEKKEEEMETEEEEEEESEEEEEEVETEKEEEEEEDEKEEEEEEEVEVENEEKEEEKVETEEEEEDDDVKEEEEELKIPRSIVIDKHPHELELCFGSPYEDKDTLFVCDICNIIMDTDESLYYCSDCDFVSHLRCASPNADVLPSLRQHQIPNAH